MAYKIRILTNGKRAPFHFRLHDARRYHGLLKRDLAQLFGVTTKKITEWETAKTMPRVTIRRKVMLWIDSHYPDPSLDPTRPPITPIYKEEATKEREKFDGPWIHHSDYSRIPAIYKVGPLPTEHSPKSPQKGKQNGK
jgi:DNA-binding XRE family transcriptional regulator